MKDSQIVHVLDIALLKVQGHVESFGQEVQSIECFGLGFGDGRDVFGSG